MLSNPSLLLSLAIVATLVPTARPSPASLQDAQQNSRQRRDSLEDFRQWLHDLFRNLRESSVTISGCSFGLANHCFTFQLDRVMQARDDLSSAASSPGKRATGIAEDIKTRAEEVLESLNEPMKAVATLRTQLEQQIQHVKRTAEGEAESEDLGDGEEDTVDLSSRR